MAQSKKRRHSVSPERGQQPQDRKKRKLNTAASSESSIAGPSRLRAERSPVPLPSDSSATLDGDSTSSSEKGKGKAVEQDPIMLELEQLRKEVAHKNELLENNKNTTASLLQALSCHVCLETMCMPHALSCGHMACQTCLVNWFTSTKNDHNVDAENEHPDIEWLSDEESDIEADGPNPEAGPVANGTHAANGHANVNPDTDGNGNVHQPAPAAAPVPNALKRRKTCPHCRCIIKQRPIQIYPVKDIIGILVPGVDQESQTSSKKDPKDTTVIDPWKGIFPVVPPPSEHDSGHDAGDSDDDAPWPGFGGMPAVPHPALPPPQYEPEPEPLSDNFVPIGDLVPLEPLPPPPLLPPPFIDEEPPPPLPPLPPPPFIDEEDGVRRCGRCLHEIWSGVCTNEDCNLIYGDSGEGEESDDGVDIMQDGNFFYGDGEDEGGQQEAQRSDAVDGDEEDGYESSFIDDGDDREGIFRRLRRRFWPRIQEATLSDVEVASSDMKVTSSTSDDDFIPGPSRRYSGGRDSSILISSSDDDVQLPCRGRRGRTQRIIDVDEEDAEEEEEQEVEGDVRSADERDILRNNLVSEHQYTESSSVPYIEEDDEYYGNGEVPYVWDEDEDEGKDLDAIYPCDGEADEEGYES